MSVKFTQLPPAGTLDGSEITCLVKDGVSVQSPLDAFSVFLTFVPEAAFIAAAGDNDNVNVNGSRYIVVDTSAGPANITGFMDGVGGRPLILTNAGPNPLGLPALDAGSSALNQLYGLPDMVIPAGASQFIVYSSILSKWVLV